MDTILLFGAGKSATALIDYLLAKAETEDWQLIVADASLQLALDKVKGHSKGKATGIDINNAEQRRQLIHTADIVISMMPPVFHILIAKDCIAYKKHFLTASYVDEEIWALKKEIIDNNLLFICELGLDPGIDHMSAMHLIEAVKEKKGEITHFHSHCGGLIAPESDTNPWHYKISWNPQNVVLAGHAGALYKENNAIVEKDYQQVFENCNTVIVPQIGTYASYPNRNSLPYISLYGLNDSRSFVRTTLRHQDFCMAWTHIIKIGLTNTTDTALLENFKHKSIKEWFTACLQFYTKSETFDIYLLKYVQKEAQETIKNLFLYIGLLSNENIPEYTNTSAAILQYLLEKYLILNTQDKDMIIMLHEITYSINNIEKKSQSTLIVKGKDALHTAMSKTVGLPLGITAYLILTKRMQLKGLHIPVIKEIYKPVLEQLRENGIAFHETEIY